jgi:hypothetical protein
MRLVKVLGVALVAVFAFSAMATTAMAELVFESSGAPLLLLASADGPQLFITLAGHLVCNTLKGHGIVETLKALTQLVTVAYTGCTASIRTLTAKPDEPIVATYLFNADGHVTIEKDITILASLAGVKCNILVLAQGPLLSVGYDNINSETEILLLSHVKNIVTDASGGGCAETYTNSSTGLYIGNAFTKAEAPGTIRWLP